MPAHLESTDRAMNADKARVRQIRNPRTARKEDRDGSEHDMPQEGEERAVETATSPSKGWRARVNAAVVLKKQGKHKKQESAGKNVRVSGEVARDGSRKEGEIRADIRAD